MSNATTRDKKFGVFTWSMPLFPVINIATFSRNVPVTIGPNWRTKRRLLPSLCIAPSQAFSVKAYRWRNRETLRYCKTSNKNVQLACNLFCSIAVERMRVQLATFKPAWQQIRLLQAVVRKFVIESRDWENVARFSSPRQTCFAASDVTPVYGVTPA